MMPLERPKIMEVTMDFADVRSDPTLGSSKVLGTLENGDRVEVIAEEHGWGLVECSASWRRPGPDERRGCVPLDHLRPVASKQPKTRRYVLADVLNVRSQPTVRPDTLVGTLKMGSPVKVDEEVGEWLRVKCDADWLDGQPGVRVGYVSQAYTRPAGRESVEALTGVAFSYWRQFRYGEGKEHQDPYSALIEKMWNSLGLGYNGRDHQDVPWSAAFLSQVVLEAGKPYDGFKFSAAHAHYLTQAILRRSQEVNGPFLGYRIDEVRPAIGDIVGMSRSEVITYDRAQRGGFYRSHADVVTYVSDKYAYAIGGNVQNSVTMKRFSLTPSGYLEGNQREFVVLKNQTL